MTISGGGYSGNSRVFDVDNGVTASISGLTISDGSAWSGNGPDGVNNAGTADPTGCTLEGAIPSAWTIPERPT